MRQSSDSGSRSGCLDVDTESLPLLSTQPKFRWMIVLVLVALMAIITGASELTWPFINQMIVDLGIAPDQKSVGFYSGLIETVASFFSFVTIMPGSFVADHWGRKTVMCGTLLGTAIGQAFFGVSSTLFGLIVCKSIVYALGPQLAWSATVTVLGDLSDDGRHGAAFSAVNASYRLGQLISPGFAALLAHPATRYVWFRSPFWIAHPYALPCWAGSALCLSGLYAIVCYLPETAPGMASVKGEEQSATQYGTITFGTRVVQDETAPSQVIPATLEPVAHMPTGQFQMGLFTPHIIQLLISSWVMYFITVSFSTLFPLWAFTPISDGGLGTPENIIGTYIFGRAVVQFLVLIPFAYCEARLGVYWLYAYSLSIFALGSTLAFPLLNLMAKSEVRPLWANSAMVLYFVVGGFGNYCTTCMVMMMNQAAPSAQALSRLVGISQSILGLGQCMAPIVTLSLFEFSIKSNFLQGNVVWVFLFCISLAASVHSFTLRMPVPNK